MLLPYTNLTYYGPDSGSAVEVAAAPFAEATIKARASMVSVDVITPTASARINVGKAAAAVGVIALIAYARISGRGRLAAIGKVNELTQDDVTGAVLESVIDDGLTLRQALRMLLGINLGKQVITDLGNGSTSIAFRDLADTKDRASATVDAFGNRTNATLDAS